MRAFTVITGLFLTTAVLAAPTPRPQGDLSDANPFNTGIEKRLDLPTKLPLDLPTGDLPTGDLTKGGIGGITDKLPLKGLPIGGDVTSLDGAKKTVDGITGNLPVKVPTDLSSVTGALSPVLKVVGGIVQTAVDSLTKADTAVKSLVKNTKGSASSLVTQIQGYVNSATEKVQDAMKSLPLDASSNIDTVQSLFGQAKVAADQLVADLDAVDSATPGVPDLVNSAKSLVQLLQGLGL